MAFKSRSLLGSTLSRSKTYPEWRKDFGASTGRSTRFFLENRLLPLCQRQIERIVCQSRHGVAVQYCGDPSCLFFGGFFFSAELRPHRLQSRSAAVKQSVRRHVCVLHIVLGYEPEKRRLYGAFNCILRIDDYVLYLYYHNYLLNK